MTPTQDALPRPHLQAADEGLAQARQTQCPFRDYSNVVRQLPTLLRRHGLGLTLAYLQMRGGGNRNSPAEIVLAQVERWLFKALGLSGRGVLPVLCTRDSAFYVEASLQARLFAAALVRCVERQSS
jgi:hypothetical protein